MFHEIHKTELTPSFSQSCLGKEIHQNCACKQEEEIERSLQRFQEIQQNRVNPSFGSHSCLSKEIHQNWSSRQQKEIERSLISRRKAKDVYHIPKNHRNNLHQLMAVGGS